VPLYPEEDSMADKEKIKEQLSYIDPFSRSDVHMVMERCGYYASPNVINHLIDRMMSENDIARVGRNKYSVSAAGNIYSYRYSDFSKKTAKEIVKAHPYLDFRIFELVQLNEFVNHQISQDIIFISVERGMEEDVFNTLWEKHRGAVLLNPNVMDIFRYMRENLIVIEKLPTESPKGIYDFWNTRLEKLLVDIAVDKILIKIVYQSEYPAIFKDAISRYPLDKSMITRYARRRGALEKFRIFLQDKAGVSPEEFSI